MTPIEEEIARLRRVMADDSTDTVNYVFDLQLAILPDDLPSLFTYTSASACIKNFDFVSPAVNNLVEFYDYPGIGLPQKRLCYNESNQ